MKKQDRAKNERHWKSIIDKFKVSGLSQSKFAKLNNIPEYKISYWKLKLEKKHETKLLPPANFIKVIPENEEVTAKFKLPDPKWVAQLIKELHALAR